MLDLLIASMLAGQAPEVRAPTAPTAPAAAAASGDPCADPAACRVVNSFELRGPQGQRLPVRMPGRPVPWLPRDNIMLFPGESVTVRLEQEGQLFAPRLVRAGAASARQAPGDGEMRVSFAQARDSALVLTIESRLPRPIDYTAVAVSAVSGPSTPPVATIQPGRTTTERWTGAIGQVAMAGFRPAGTPAPGAAAVASMNEPELREGRLLLPIGRTATVRLDEGPRGAVRPVLQASGRSADRARTAVEEAARRVGRNAPEDRETLTAVVAPPGTSVPPLATGTVRFSFEPEPGGGRGLLLVVENGYDRAVDYSAVMRFRDGRRARTTICRVLPGRLGIERWTDPIAVLELESFEFRPRGDLQQACD